ncbi:MAG: ATP-binding protein [Polyangiaceae bacterium]
MGVRLGIPEALADAPLPRRLAWITLARLGLLVVALALLGVFYLRGGFRLETYSVQIALIVLGLSFALAGVYAAMLRSGKRLELLAYAQLVFDQLTWTALVYLTGGASSGATSFFGLSCLMGAILLGLPGATLAAGSAAAFYAALVALLRFDVLSPPPDQPATLYRISSDELAYYGLVNLLMLVVVTLLAGYLAERLRVTGGQLQQAEKRAEQAERMAALGRLAAGLAHEIRNPLGAIAGSISLLETSSALGDEDRVLCAIVQREAARLNDLVTDMMDLTRPRAPQRTAVDIAQIAREVVELSRASGRGLTDVDVQYAGEDSVTVDADSAQMRQLVWNLVRNAVQASRAGDVVKVGVMREGEGVLLSVKDDGVGIDAEARERIFDAFFTTRSKGTGVGLAVVKRIVDDHGFAIEVLSEHGRGARFDVHLPVVNARA